MISRHLTDSFCFEHGGGRGLPAFVPALLLLSFPPLLALLHARNAYVNWTRHFNADKRRSRVERGCPSHKRAPIRRRRRSSVSESLDSLRHVLMKGPVGRAAAVLRRHASSVVESEADPALESEESAPLSPSLLGRSDVPKREPSSRLDPSNVPKRELSSVGSRSFDTRSSSRRLGSSSSASAFPPVTAGAEPPRFVRPSANRRESSFSVAKSKALDMDHIHLSFPSFLWGMFFIWPCVAFKAAVGILQLMLRKKLCGLGLLRPTPFDPRKVCYDLCVHSTLPVYFDGYDDDGRMVYQFNDIVMVNGEGECETVESLELKLDVEKKTLVSALMNGVEELTARETLNLVFYYLVNGHHTKIHSLANWAVVPPELVQDPSRETDFVVRNGITTVMYNYFGYSGFKDLFPTFKRLGLVSLSDPVKLARAVTDGFSRGINSGVPEHSKIAELAPHSPFVDFIVKLRPFFLSEFVKHKQCFPGCNIEALFAGTVVHSLDHALAGWNVPDPLWFDVDNPRFGMMGEVNRIVRAAFVEDLVGLVFHKSFRDSGHPFYDAVYAKAATINKKYADSMDTCIIK